MNKYTLILFFLFLSVIAYTQTRTDAQLSTDNTTLIKNSTPTPSKMGTFNDEMIASKLNINRSPSINFAEGNQSSNINREFIVYASGTLRTDYHSGGTPVFDDPIQWSFAEYASTAYSETFFRRITGNTTDKHLEIYFPNVKSIIGGSYDPDEVTVPRFLSLGSQKFVTNINGESYVSFMANQPSIPSISFTGNGAGSWTVGGNFTSFFATNLQNGYAEVGPYQINTVGSYGTVSFVYMGKNNYHCMPWLTGTYGYGFYLVNSLGQVVLNPTTDDIVIANGFQIVPELLDMAVWKGTNNWLKDLSSFTLSMIFEAWMIGYPMSGTSAQVKCQAVPTATNYKIYRSTNANFSTQTLIYSGTALNFTDTGLVSNTKYYYKMIAVLAGVDTLITYYNIRTI